ncbi:MAG: hypothetical protein MN733_24870, partial [Nitrososphaera sp.]|nr:hypothetical protein [Nitrososphaera sp.]
MNRNDVDSLCQYLDWDSDFFGCRIARITAHRLNHETIERIMMWCDSHHIDCLYFLGDIADKSTLRLAEDNKFRLMDIRVTLEKQLEDTPTAGGKVFGDVIRPCAPRDV